MEQMTLQQFFDKTLKVNNIILERHSVAYQTAYAYFVTGWSAGLTDRITWRSVK